MIAIDNGLSAAQMQFDKPTTQTQTWPRRCLTG